jgi:hypothetical protein
MPGTKNYDISKLEVAVEDFVDHLSDDLPPGPPSELGGEVPGLLEELSDAELNRLAAVGKKMIDTAEAEFLSSAKRSTE